MFKREISVKSVTTARKYLFADKSSPKPRRTQRKLVFKSGKRISLKKTSFQTLLEGNLEFNEGTIINVMCEVT